MKISRLELVTIVLTAMFAAFAAGWFLRGSASAEPIRVSVERSLTAQTPVLALPAPGSTAQPKININTADSETLQTLPGVGAKRAEDIIAYREQNGPFRIPEDLTKVKGIGEATMERLIDYITTGEQR